MEKYKSSKRNILISFFIPKNLRDMSIFSGDITIPAS